MSQSQSKFAPPPAMTGGDSIDLNPLLDKIVAINVSARSKTNTRFGERQLSTVTMLVEGTKEPIRGVLFASFFQKLETGLWYIGRIAKPDRAWGMIAEDLDKKKVAALMKLAEALPSNDDVPW